MGLIGHSKKISFIVNPHSANGRTGKKWPEIRKKAANRLGPFNIRMTNGPGDATDMARQCLREGSKIVVSVGGDGTLNEVINGLGNQKGAIDPGVSLGIVPSGTGCDFSRSLDIPHELDAALELIARTSRRRIDLGRLTYETADGLSSCRYFVNIVSFGLGGEVDRRVNGSTKVFGGFLSFVWATFISLLSYKKKNIDLSIDHDFHENVTVWNVVVANGNYHGGGMFIAPGADTSDGLFQVTVIGDLKIHEVFRNLPKLYNGRIYDHDRITEYSGREIRANSSEEVLIDMDGEQPGRLPLYIEMIPSAVNLICT
ncbi:MAG: diacylglycerol kinase family protein [Desulfatiglans sp.]|jgi:YegS/Rv2252/BmrU family lipid kinase|nr:diacylglycerol kinase family protein [Desulfatiglans sp.]